MRRTLLLLVLALGVAATPSALAAGPKKAITPGFFRGQASSAGAGAVLEKISARAASADTVLLMFPPGYPPSSSSSSIGTFTGVRRCAERSRALVSISRSWASLGVAWWVADPVAR